MKVKIQNQLVNVLENLHIPEVISETREAAFLNGQAEDSFYVCDLGDIVRKHELWCQKVPNVEPFYAIKCNPTDIVVKMLAKLNIGFDCASKSEIAMVINAGVHPDRIIYANPCKQASHIKYAELNGVKLMTFDSLPELSKIAIFHPAAQLVLRIFVGATKALCPLGLKFGVTLSEAPELLSMAMSLNLNVIGVSFHVGSGCFDATAYRTAISMAHKIFEVANVMGNPLSLLDIGGGFPGNLDTPESMDFFGQVCDTINSCLNEYFPPESGIRVIAEPGRYYVSSAFHLACTVTSVRCSYARDSIFEDKFNYFLNDGVYGSFNCTVFDHYIPAHYLLHEKSDQFESDSTTYPSIFWGPTCDNADKILDDFRIRKLEVGECVVFKNMGAYTMAAASTFNGFQLSYVHYYSTIADWKSLESLLIDDLSALDESYPEMLREFENTFECSRITAGGPELP